MKLKKILKIVSASLVLVMLTINSASAFSNFEEIKGNDRYETAGIIADKQVYNTVILVNSDKSLADGLSASGLSGAVNAPILLVNEYGIPKETDKRLINVKKAYIIGGTSAISDKVMNIVKSKGIEVKRIAGNDRIETSEEVAKEIKNITGYNEIFLVNGFKGEADAMSVAAISARDISPIILTDGKSTNIETKGKKVYAVGGLGVISEELVKNVKAKRLSGKDRFETNKAIIKEFYSNPKEFYVTKGYKLVDALTLSSLAQNRPVVLVEDGSDKSVLSKATKIINVGGVDYKIIQQISDTIDRGINEVVNSDEYIDIVRDEMYKLINEYRNSKGIASYKVNSKLEKLADLKATHMAENRYLDKWYKGQYIYEMYPDVYPLDPSDKQKHSENIARIEVSKYTEKDEKHARKIANEIFSKWLMGEATTGGSIVYPNRNVILKEISSEFGFSIHGIQYEDNLNYTIYATLEVR